MPRIQATARQGEKIAAIRLTPAEQRQIDSLAAAKQRKPHWIMKEALRQYLERESAAEQLRQETLKSWDEYVQTGLHVNEEQVNTWLDSWGSENETEPPSCHD
jgi:predicted transcriptional regulator